MSLRYPRRCDVDGGSENKQQYVMLLEELALDVRLEVGNEPVFCQLRHPRTSKGSIYLFSHSNQNVFEVQNFKEEFCSWLIGETVQQDGSVLITSPVDPIFLALPYLIKMEKTGKYMTIDQLIHDDDFPECTRLCSCVGMGDLSRVADIKDNGDIKAYRFSKEKSLSWLKTKIDRVTGLLAEQDFRVSGGAVSEIYVCRKQKHSSQEDLMKFAAGIVSEYLPVVLSSDLRDHLGFSSLPQSNSQNDEAQQEEPPTKRARSEPMAPTEDYSKMADKHAKIKPKKLTPAQKKLKNKFRDDMKTISSYFGPTSQK